jgi:hypothetical protein
MSLLASMQLDLAQAYRKAMLESLVHKFQMDEIYEYIQMPQFDTNNAYHHAQHCMRVALRGVELLTAGGCVEQSNLMVYDCQILMCAAFFHDFGHTGKGPDINNIEIAVSGLRNAGGVFDYFGRGNEEVRIIEGAIRCTEYVPGEGFPKKPHTRVQRALRDADLMESLEPHCIQYVMHDLCKELGVDMIAAIPKQIEFLKSAEMFTRPGKYIWDTTLEARIACIEALKNG